MVMKQKILKRIARKRTDVFFRKDFKDLAGYDQVGRALRQLVTEGQLVKIGYGLYARAKKSPLSGKTIPNKTLPKLATEALNRLNVKVSPSKSNRDYNEGRTTQVPTGRVIGVRQRISRKIGYNGKYVSFQLEK
jgi:hypothetical protein